MQIRNLFTIFLIVLMAAMMVMSFSYEGTAAFGFPFAVALIVLVMGVLLLIGDLTIHKAKAANVAEPEEKKNLHWGGVGLVYLLLIGFLLISMFLSYLVAVPVLLFVMAYFVSREGLIPSAVLAVGVGGAIYILFDRILGAF